MVSELGFNLFMEVSAKENYGVEALFERAITLVRNMSRKYIHGNITCCLICRHWNPILPVKIRKLYDCQTNHIQYVHCVNYLCIEYLYKMHIKIKLQTNSTGHMTKLYITGFWV